MPKNVCQNQRFDDATVLRKSVGLLYLSWCCPNQAYGHSFSFASACNPVIQTCLDNLTSLQLLLSVWRMVFWAVGDIPRRRLRKLHLKASQELKCHTLSDSHIHTDRVCRYNPYDGYRIAAVFLIRIALIIPQHPICHVQKYFKSN